MTAARRPMVRRTGARALSVSFPVLCRALGLPAPVAEHKFHPVRRWRFDWAFLDQRVALEIEGGVFIQGRHSRGAGMVKDMEKYAEATILGWRVLRVTPRQMADGSALTLVERALTGA